MAEQLYDPNIEVTKAEALEITGVKEGTLRNYMLKGRLTVRYVKGKTSNIALYKRAECERVKAENDNSLNPSVVSNPSKTSSTVEGEVVNDTNPSNLSKTNLSTNPSNPSTELALAEKSFPTVGQGSDYTEMMAAAFAQGLRLAESTNPATLSAKTTVTPAEAAIITGLSETTIRKAVKEGKLAGDKVGRGTRVLTEALTPWVRTLFTVK